MWGKLQTELKPTAAIQIGNQQKYRQLKMLQFSRFASACKKVIVINEFSKEKKKKKTTRKSFVQNDNNDKASISLWDVI